MKKLVAIAFFCAFSFYSFGQTAEYKTAVKQMIQKSGSEGAFTAAITQIIGMYKQSKSEIPDAFWTELEVEMKKTTTDELSELLSPIYFKHLTIDDIKQVTAFYDSPVGKKYAEKTPLIMQESMAAGQEWGSKLAGKIEAMLKEKGY